jgi:eukaryotic translation initiation factor 2C
MGKSENIPAGTVVDTGIVGLNQFDFYLCSHETIQGTAQPTHYYVIHDENRFSSNDIQNLTFMMCHLYVKSTKAVSIPAPVYYAHLAAFRGRMYKQADANSDTQSEAAPAVALNADE